MNKANLEQFCHSELVKLKIYLGQGVLLMSKMLVLHEALKFIEKNVDNDITVESVAKEIGYSKFHFSRLFKSEFDVTLQGYITERRLHNASKEILKGQNVLNVAVKYGYDTHSGFSKAFKKHFGYSPKVLSVFRLAEVMFSSEGVEQMNTEKLFSKLNDLSNVKYSKSEHHEISIAFEYAKKCHEGIFRYSGEPYINHSLCVALLLVELEQSAEVVLMGILHDILDVKYSNISDLRSLPFDDNIKEKLDQLNELIIDDDFISYDESAIMIKLADRLHNMRTLEHLSKERWNKKAKETLALFSPVARKLEIPELTMELDNLSVKYIENQK